MGLAQELLARGFFPREVPPCFSSEAFAKFAMANSLELPKKQTAEVGVHSLARVGTLRRTLGIPNPIAEIPLVRTLETAWPQLKQQYEKSDLSLTRPVPTPGAMHRACEPYGRLGIRPRKRLSARSGRRTLVRADVNGFYHAIYTHSIPWALHDKSTAKRNHSDALVGNLIDKHLRGAQFGQTVGIPIGPDSSLLIAEIILSSVDKILRAQFPQLRGFRYIDDYELTCYTESQAQDVLHCLEESLAYFELRLNPYKTSIIELPLPYSDSWLPPLRDYEFVERNAPLELQSMMQFFDVATQLRDSNPRTHVIRCALGRLCKLAPHVANLEHYQQLLISASTWEPGCLARVLARLQELRLKDIEIDSEALEEHLNDVVEYHSIKGHSNEVAWALFGLSLFELPLHENARRQVERSTDDFVALLAMRLAREKLVNGDFNLEQLTQCVTAEELYGRHWLLAYEAVVSGLIAPDYPYVIELDPSFDVMQKAKVSFLQEIDRTAELVLSSPGLHDVDADEAGDYSLAG